MKKVLRNILSNGAHLNNNIKPRLGFINVFSSKHLLPDVARCDVDIRKGRNFAVNHQKQMQESFTSKANY